MRALGTVLYAARALRGSLTVNLPVSPQVRRDFRLDVLSGILFGIFNGSVISFLYVVGRTIGVSTLGISLLVAMPAVGSILSLPISLTIQGPAARTFMLTSWTVGRALILLILLAGAPLPYVIIAALYQISSSMALPFYAAMMQQIYPMEFRGRLMSLVRVGSGAVTTLTGLAVGWLLGSAHTGYSMVFAAGSIAGIISMVVFSRITSVQPRARSRQSLRATFAILGQSRHFTAFQVGMFGMGFGNIMAGTLYPLVVVDRLHGGYGAYGVLTVLSSLGYLVSFFVWGRVVDTRGPIFAMALTGSLIIFLPLGMLLAPGVWWLIPVALVTGVSVAGFELGIYSAVIHFAPPLEVARYFALHSNFAGIRGLIAPFLATALLGSARYGLALGCSALIILGGTAMLWRSTREEARVRAQRLAPSRA